MNLTASGYNDLSVKAPQINGDHVNYFHNYVYKRYQHLVNMLILSICDLTIYAYFGCKVNEKVLNQPEILLLLIKNAT